MLSTALNLVLGLFRFDLKRSVRAKIVTTALTLAALLAWVVAAGFGLSLLYIWLERSEGTVLALSLLAGGCAVLGLMLLLIAILRPRRREVPEPQHRTFKAGLGGSEQMLDQAITEMQRGSRESMLAAVVLGLVAGMMVGRKL